MMVPFGARIGIDVGGRAIKVAALAGRRPRIVGAAPIAPPPPGEEGARDPREVARLVAEAIEGMGVRVGAAALGVSGREAITRYSRVPDVPDWRLELIMRYEIEDVAGKVGEPLAAGWTPLATEREPGEEQAILVALAKEKALAALLEALEARGIRCDLSTPVALGLYGAYRTLGGAHGGETVLLADLGAESVDLVIARGGALAFARSASFGARQFTDAVASALGIPRDEAERIKVTRGGLGSGEEKVERALRGVAGQLAALLRSTVQFAKVQTGWKGLTLDRVELAGGGARLPGLDRYISENLGVPCERFDPVSRLPHEELPAAVETALTRAPGTFAPALGLALAAERPGEVPVDLTPAPRKARRAFRARTVYLYAAGAMLAALLLVHGAGALAGSSGARKRHAEVRRVLGDLQTRQVRYEEIKAENARIRARVDAVLEEVTPTAFTACLLGILGRSEVPELAVKDLALRRTDEPEGDGVMPVFAWRVEGRADNANGKALEHIDAFKAEIAAHPRVGSVDHEAPPEDAGSAYRFTLIVRPRR